jgi:hypothetical protein
MQLTIRVSPHRRRRVAFLIEMARTYLPLAAAATLAPDARGSDPAVPDQTQTARPERPGSKRQQEPDGSIGGRSPSARATDEPEDGTAKHASIEFATYGDTDHVQVVTPSITMGISNVSGASLNASYLVDVVSAASIDIVSTASTRAGWGEVRHAGTISGQYKPHDFGVAVGGSVSSEPDYLSYGAYAMIVKDFNQKNWTITFGYGFSHDIAGRCGVGGACTPFVVFSHELQRGSFNGGLSWVVNRDSLASVSVDVVLENGDQSKPYRYVPTFSPDVARQAPLGASIEWVNANRLPEKPLEQLPLSRDRLAVTGGFAHRFDFSTVRFEERVYDDSWGLLASSTDLKWIFDLGEHWSLWPHVRYHLQSPVNFWQRAYVSEPGPGFNLPLYRTGDRELGPLSTAGGGFGVRWRPGGSQEEVSWQIGLTGDLMYTSFSDDLYLLSRTSYLGALRAEGSW